MRSSIEKPNICMSNQASQTERCFILAKTKFLLSGFFNAVKLPLTSSLCQASLIMKAFLYEEESCKEAQSIFQYLASLTYKTIRMYQSYYYTYLVYVCIIIGSHKSVDSKKDKQETLRTSFPLSNSCSHYLLSICCHFINSTI